MVGDLNKREYEMGEILGIALAMFQERAGIIIGGILFFSIVPALAFIPVGFAAVGVDWTAIQSENFDFTKLLPLFFTSSVCFLVYLLIYYVLRVGWISICLKITRAEPAPFSEFFSNFGYLLNFLVVHFLVGIVVGAAFVCLVIPAIFVGIKLCFSPFLVIDQNMGPLEAMKSSWGMTEGYFWKIFLAGLSFLVINIISGFIPFLGIAVQIVALGYLDLLITALYRAKKGDLAAPN